MMRSLLALLALFVAANAAAQVYGWTDEKGRVIYGGAQRAAAPAGPVLLYATDWCPYCAKARAYFAKNGIRYVEYDIEKNPAARAEYKRLGGRGVPLIVHGSSVMRGFSEQSFEAFVARSAR